MRALRSTLLVAVLLVSPLAAAVARADAPPEPPAADVPGAPARPLALEEVLRIARDRNRDVAAAREHLKQVAVDIDRAWVPLLPTVSAQGKYTHNNIEISVPNFTTTAALMGDVVFDMFQLAPQGKTATDLINLCKSQPSLCQAPPPLDTSQVSSGPLVIQPQEQLDFVASAQVPLVVPYAYAQLKAAREGLVAQQKTTEATESQILLQVAGAFYAAAGNVEMLAARAHGVEVAERTLADAQVRLMAGVVNRVEVDRAQVAVLRAQQAQRETRDGVTAAYRALRTIAGIDFPFAVVPAAEPAAVERSLPELQRSALSLRREILALDRQVIIADENVLANKLRWAPSLSGFGLARAFNYNGFANQKYAWAVGLELDWLLYDGGLRQAGAHQFESLARELKLRREQTKDQIADEVANLRDQVETKRRGLAEARKEVELARETLELVRVAHEAGTATQLDLLTAQDSLVLAELQVARLRFDLGQTDLQLRRAAGTFPDDAMR